ncbi:DUF4129 domain-containing protein [Gordonia sp. TBRC 11910]|uniref:DUF4129 domain-containing protein n=1 Tax=Gordonia asplenii TaxID=2725283 RepID=A0A848KZ02_9ACTN|nr:DUF4129 domain-containing protein [Gordonia asplenii]NMO03442.1 DUF4129 domain-containing protein [Gordonia asplenii]
MSATRTLAAGLDPSNDEARRWLEDELRKNDYHPQPSWWDRISDAIGRWFSDFFQNVFGSDSGSTPLIISIVIALAILAGAVYLLARLRRNRRAEDTATGDRAVLGSSKLTAAQHRELATEALQAGDYLRSIVCSMRAIAQEAVERTLLTRAASLTAHEIAYRLTAPFPTLVNELLSGADLFDDVAYGGRPATHEHALTIQALDTKLKSTKPRLVDDVEAPPPSLPPIREAAR